MTVRANSTPSIRLTGPIPAKWSANPSRKPPKDGVPVTRLSAAAAGGAVWRVFGKSLEDAARQQVARKANRRVFGRLDKNKIALLMASNLVAVRVAHGHAPVFVGAVPQG